MHWLSLSLFTMLIFGFWGFFPKLATRYISPQSAFVYQALGSLVTALLALLFLGFRPEIQPRGMLFAFLTGVAGIAGGLLYLFAVQHGRIGVVVTLTALYPVITILLAAIFLHEPISLRQGLGMLFAVIAIALIAA
ncbi:MAG: EamA family transporter [Anaerolineales bacterium]|nr:EamA family transporter [Anaerolineales bacterium]